MEKISRYAYGFVAAAAICFGFIALAANDFHRGLMPVPTTLPGRIFFLYATAAALVVFGAGLFIKKWRFASALSLGALYLLLFFFIHLLKLVREIFHPNEWTAPAEMLLLSAGAIFVARLFLPIVARLPRILTVTKIFNFARWVFALGMLVFAFLHFKYADFIATLIPAWIPFRYAFTILIGIGFAAAAISIMVNRAVRWAGWSLGVMFLTWVLVLHLPRAIAKPTDEAEWTSLFVALAMSGASFTLARLQGSRGAPADSILE